MDFSSCMCLDCKLPFQSISTFGIASIRESKQAMIQSRFKVKVTRREVCSYEISGWQSRVRKKNSDMRELWTLSILATRKYRLQETRNVP